MLRSNEEVTDINAGKKSSLILIVEIVFYFLAVAVVAFDLVLFAFYFRPIFSSIIMSL